MTTKRWLGIGLASILVLGAVAGFLVGSRLTTPEQAAANARPPAQRPVTGQLQQRVLTLGVTARGALASGSGYSLHVPTALAGESAVVTSVLIAAGQQLTDGMQILDVSGEPLVAAVLPFPLYRDLHHGDTGPDVAELDAFLDRQGYDSSGSDTVDADFEAGVRQLLKQLGYNALAASTNPLPPPSPTTASTDPSTTDHIVFARKWIIQLDRSNRRLTTVNAHVGTVLDSADLTIASLDVTSPRVRSYLDTEALKHVKVGDHAVATDDSGSRQVQLTVSSVDTTDTTDPNTNSPGRAISMSATEPNQLAGISGELTVRLAIALSDKPELVAPISGVRTTTAGDSTVVLSDAQGSQTTVPVKIGTCSDGWCEIDAGNTKLEPGAAVVVSEPN